MILHGRETADSCVHYWVPTEQELEELGLETFEPIEHAMAAHIIGLHKKVIPSFCNTPSQHPEVIAQQQAWFAKRVKEESIVLEKEREAFEAYYLKERKDLNKHLALNK